MTEREKMIAGLPYSVLDEELIHYTYIYLDACVLCDSILPQSWKSAGKNSDAFSAAREKTSS